MANIVPVWSTLPTKNVLVIARVTPPVATTTTDGLGYIGGQCVLVMLGQ
jgi:hypothetical protein